MITLTTLIVPAPNGKHIRISTDNRNSENDAVNQTIITMILRSYRDNGCRI